MLEESFVKNMPKLGFGLMRLPKNEDGSIDVEQTALMGKEFLEAGQIYCDSAYVYTGSEEAARKAIVERQPRESFYITSKLNVNALGTTDEESAKAQLEESMRREGVDYIDFYLLHALGKKNIQKYDDWHIWEFVKQAKEEGKIRHYGFSFHDDAEFLDELLTKHPDVEFVQLQINYADWDSPSVQSRLCYEVACKHNKPVIVMEPVKGGTLANPPKAVAELFKQANPDMSFASWAIRFVASLPNVMVVLSGMSDIEQMRDNLSYMKDFKPLTEEEMEVIRKAQEILRTVDQIPCTGCRYCVEGCPMQINIPAVFSAMNMKLIYEKEEAAKRRYAGATEEKGKASACIGCGQCELQCPQQIEIRNWLARVASELE